MTIPGSRYIQARGQHQHLLYVVNLAQVANLECKELMEEYERNHPDEDKGDSGSSKRKAEDKPSQPKKKQDTRPKGFSRGLTAEKIIGATNDPGELYFLIKVFLFTSFDKHRHRLGKSIVKVRLNFRDQRMETADTETPDWKNTFCFFIAVARVRRGGPGPRQGGKHQNTSGRCQEMLA